MTCTDCAEDYFAASFGTLACERCPDFATGNHDHSGCQCLPGYASAASEMGREVVGANFTCTPCAAGTFSEGSGECVACEPGTSSDVIGAKSAETCSPCQDNSFASMGGSVACEECPANAYSVDHRTCACMDGVDTLIAHNTTLGFTCGECSLGHYLEEATMECRPCDANMIMNETIQERDNTICIACPENAVSCHPTASSQCPTAGTAAGTACACSLGFYTFGDASYHGFSCIHCPEGSYL
eukprot:gene31975-40383_t